MAKTKTNQLRRVDIRGMNISVNAAALIIDGKRIELTTTACNYGKSRYWFACPYCSGRVAVLYLGKSGLGCRKCYRLAYPVENKTRSDRAIDGGFKIRGRLRVDARNGTFTPLRGFLSSTIESIRLQCEQIFKDYDATWDETEAHYRKMKQALSAIIDIEKEAFERKTKQLEVIKNG